ncbi:Serine/arginine repetitive matrix protein 1 [Thelohanellus kitauei]|uniref:Serine/arginine repetitive matrix protein 1 n=1 Tax=Thelohanellus kitauei TaxID=669202 RepID=A0A0C2MTX2_THEKT|nr:Serine/arginine repetitive matrix protein 1 [Thelohanellus kitauei]
MKGTSREQDARFPNRDKKILKTLKFDPLLDHKVDMSKVMLDTMKTWIAARISGMLGFEDEVVIDYLIGMLENDINPDPKQMQMHLTGFLEAKNARIFMRELWHLLKSAEENNGVPKEFIELKMAELAEAQKRGEVIDNLMSTVQPVDQTSPKKESSPS